MVKLVRRAPPGAKGEDPGSIVESSQEAIVGLTREGIVTFWNPAATRLYGYTPEEIVGAPGGALYPPERRAETEEVLAGILRGGEIGHYLTDGMHKDGTIIGVSLTASPMLDSAGVIVGVATVSRRRTESQEAKLQQAQRLESLGQLAGGVAHDFNNLLAVILNYASFVSEELGAATDSDWSQCCESARKDVEQIQQAASRAAALTRQLLAFARQEAIRPQVLNLNDVIASVEEMLRRTIGENIQLVTTPAARLWPVLADPGRLEQVLVNLAVNARDAMPGGGTMTIDTANITVDADSIAGGSPARQGHNVRLRVSDTGTGMPPEVAEHAFEPFFTTKSKSAGTGLGLATVFGILSQADGHIQIYTERGNGTTISITLPVTDEAPIAIAEPVPYQRVPTGETVLIVEDEEALREVTKRIFTRNGYHVITAADGPEAVDIARHHDGEIHLLVTDVVMPHMLGKEVADEMKTIKPDIEVLYMSGYARPVLASQGRLDPGVALVEKPFSETDLLNMARQLLNGHFSGFKTVRRAPADAT
jgi:PAS domain S-box-containing protein